MADIVAVGGNDVAVDQVAGDCSLPGYCFLHGAVLACLEEDSFDGHF